MERVRIGIIGLGRFAERHLAAWSGLGDVEVAAICSHSPARLDELGAQYGIAGRYTDAGEMLRSARLDAVDVITADHAHTEPVLQALAAGVHVLVEKPMATTLEEADRMLAAAEAAGRILMVGHVLRFDPRYYIVRQRIDAGEVGKIGSIYSYRNLGQAMIDTYTYGCPILGGIIHDVDLVLWYAGDTLDAIEAMGRCTLGKGVADSVWALLKFAGGAIGVVTNSWLNPAGAPSHMDAGLEIRGAGATIQIRDPDRGVSVWTAERGSNPFSVTWGRSYGRLMGPLKEELAYFAARVRGDPLPAVQSPAEAREALRVSLQIIDALEAQGVPMRLP